MGASVLRSDDEERRDGQVPATASDAAPRHRDTGVKGATAEEVARDHSVENPNNPGAPSRAMDLDVDEIVSAGVSPERRGETPVISGRGLKRHYPLTRGVFKRTYGHVRAVDGVDFDLYRGETLGVVGESGCGKSTLGRLIMSLEKPTDGQLFYKGRDVADFNASEFRDMRRNVQMVLQDPYTSLNPRMTVGDIIGEPFKIHKDVLDRSKRTARVKELIELVGLNPEHINRYPHQFSGGQRQRIGIARGLALNPEVIVCDEPVSALDVSVQAQVVNLMEDLQNELGLSYIFVAHDLSVVRHISDRVAVMYLGRMVELGNEDQIYSRPVHPYTQALLSAVPVPDPELRGKRDQIRLEGDVPSPANPPSGCRFRTRCWKAVELCATSDPQLEVREGTDHPSRCIFSEERQVIEAVR
ncbi:ABC transporter ATP-binding protein [Kytococcus sp. Marseille-QA3725]